MALDIIRRMRRCGCSLTVWDTHRRDWRGQNLLGYRLRASGVTIFEGEDFASSPMHADDSDEAMGALFCFLTLKPGDTDRDYFSGYTPGQLAWCESSQAQELQLEAMRLSGELTE